MMSACKTEGQPDMASSTASDLRLELKADFADAVRRWEAYIDGQVIDRPVVLVSCHRPGAPQVSQPSYKDKIFLPFDTILGQALESARGVWWGGEAIPSFFPSFGADEVALFCSRNGAFVWNDDSPGTNWSHPFIHNWEDELPLQLNKEHPLWKRMLSLLDAAASKLAGKMCIGTIDLHTNLGLLAAARGGQELCFDLVDYPEMIDRGLADARALFPTLWEAVTTASRSKELGYAMAFFSFRGAAVLQCDFSTMISPEMFRRWVLPALEEEAGIVRHAYYHWDGVGALKHKKDIISSRNLHTLGFLPGEGHGRQIEYLDLFKECQAAGKGVHVGGPLEECQAMHRELRPDKTIYTVFINTPAEGEAALEWFKRNT